MITDIAVIGGGAAGLAAAIHASDDGVKVMLIERLPTLGGILNQCIHTGFGLRVFKEELTGPEYAERFIQMLRERKIETLLDATANEIRKTDTGFSVDVSSASTGWQTIECRAVVLATGCYERTRGAVHIPGERPKGIMPAGSAQRYLNIDGYLVGKRVFVLGSGDIGLIMARRMTLEGAKVLGVAEIMPYSNGLTRNIVQCLNDFDIPLYLSHTVTEVRGHDRLESITVQAVDASFVPIPGTEIKFDVDTLLLSIGLVPDTTLFKNLGVACSPITRSAIVDQHYESSVPGLFLCGNALQVHDLVDNVTLESEKAGSSAKRFIREERIADRRLLPIVAGPNVRYTVPQQLDLDRFDRPVEISFRVTKKTETGVFRLTQNGRVIKEKTAKFIAPAEMDLFLLSPSDLTESGPVTLSMEVVEA